jgi:hypothetical protein
MNTKNYENDELELLEAIENNQVQSVAFDNEQIKSRAKQTIKYNNENKQISININKYLLEYTDNR